MDSVCECRRPCYIREGSVALSTFPESATTDVIHEIRKLPDNLVPQTDSQNIHTTAFLPN